MTENKRFGLVFAKTWSINSGTGRDIFENHKKIELQLKEYGQTRSTDFGVHLRHLKSYTVDAHNPAGTVKVSYLKVSGIVLN
jgi:hypothetical protein